MPHVDGWTAVLLLRTVVLLVVLVGVVLLVRMGRAVWLGLRRGTGIGPAASDKGSRRYGKVLRIRRRLIISWRVAGNHIGRLLLLLLLLLLWLPGRPGRVGDARGIGGRSAVAAAAVERR